MVASVTSPKRALLVIPIAGKNESAIKPRFNKISWVDRRNDPTVPLLKDAVAAGWTERGNTSNLDAENAKGDGSGDKELACARKINVPQELPKFARYHSGTRRKDPRNCPYRLAFKK